MATWGLWGQGGVAAAILNTMEFRTYAVQSLYVTNPDLLGTSFFVTLPNMLERTAPPTAAEVAG